MVAPLQAVVALVSPAGSLVLALLGILVLGLVVQHVLTVRERRRFPTPGALVDVGGYRLHLKITGSKDGPTVVLDSALAGSSLSWDGVQPHLEACARVVSYDRAGFGWSDPAPKPRRVDVMVEELRAALAAASLRPPYFLVGHSYGGWIAQLFAGRHRDEVAGLVLVDVPHPRTWATPDEAQRQRVRRGAQAARRGAWLAHFGITRLIFRLAASGRVPVGERGRVTTLLEKIPPSLRAPLRTFWVRPQTLGALASLIENAPESAALVSAALRDMGDLPLRVLTESRPDEARRADQEAVAALSTRSRHVVAESAGHWIPFDEPSLVVTAVREILGVARVDLP